MLSSKGRKVIVGIVLALSAVTVILLIVYVLGKLVDIWWYNSLGYEFYFWQRLFYSYTVFIVVTLVFWGFFFFNLRVASRVLSVSGGSANREPR